VLSVVRETACDPQKIELEITECFLMLNIEAATRALDDLRNAGISLTLEDFGTGFSSLDHLSRLAMGAVKIDGSFILDLLDNRHHAAITRSIISLAHNLDMRVIAERVENHAQLEFLRECGCDEIQGFYYSRPLPAEKCLPLLTQSWPVAGVPLNGR
jgi:EAL domain-containing protein (putative c-di-GMP-specific phosphodiesterase class I)